MAAPYSGRVIDYLAGGLIAARPASLNLQPGTIGVWYATDVGAEQLSVWDGAVWANIAGGGGGSVAWGAITGTLTAQADLVAALLLKQNRSPTIQTTASTATFTPALTEDLGIITAQAAALNIANPTGTAISGLGYAIRIKDNGTARAITYGTQYRALGITLPTTTVISKTLYLGMIWNAADTVFDVVSVAQQA